MARKGLALEAARSMLPPEEQEILEKYEKMVMPRPGEKLEDGAILLKFARADEVYPQIRGIEKKLAEFQEKILKSGRG